MSGVDPALLSQIRYRNIGPSRGGRVIAVAADPVKKNVFYFGACAGVVGLPHAAGQYWENISDGFFKTGSVGALAVAPSDGNVIYAGMGESTIRIDVTHGDGVYKSTDAGVSWQHMGLEATRHIGKIAVHPADPDTLYVAALGHMSKDNPERGLYRSTDGGATWELVLHISEKAGAVDVSLDPNNPRIIFTTIWESRRNFWSINSGGEDCGLWRSKDGGDTWEDLSRNKGMPEGTLGKMGVAVSPAQSGRVWAMVEAEFRKRGLYRSEDHGETWEKVSSKPELGWRPWYYEHVVAHPTDGDTVYVLNNTAFVSIDGGKNWEEFNTPHGDNHALWIDPEDPMRMIGSDDGGAWVSVNGGASWSTIYNQMTAQLYHVDVDDQYPYLVYGSQQDNSSIAVPSQTGLGAINWADCYPPGTAESGYVAVKPDDPNIVYVGAIGSSPGGGDALQRYDHTTKQIQLVSVWPESVHDGNTAEVRFQWTYPIMFSPHDTGTLYAAGNKVFKSTDEGHSWTAISDDLTYADPETMGVSGPLTMDTAGAEMYATVFSLMVSAHTQGVLMAGSDDGRVHVTHDDGGSWTEVTPPDLPKFSQVTMLEEAPHRPGRVYLTAARHKMGDDAPYVFVTDDLGSSWTRIDAGLPEEICRVIREDPSAQGLLYVGTEMGLYASFDDGANWQSLQSNLPVTPVYDMKVKGTDLVVATHGRSFWILDDLTPLHQLQAGLGEGNHLLAPRPAVRAPEHLFAAFWGSPKGKNYHVTIGQNATFYLDEAETGHKRKRVIDGGDDAERGVRINYWLTEDATGEAVLTISDADGNVVDTFPSAIPEEKSDRKGLYITAHQGMNTFQWPMMLPAGEKMVDTEYHGRPAGPLALPGTYTATLTVGDWSMSQPVELVLDPRVSVEHEHLVEQQELMLAIQSKLDEMTVAINAMRSMYGQLDGWAKRLGDDEAAADVVAAIAPLQEQLREVEAGLVQRELTSAGDSLNYRESVWEKLSGLSPIVSSADTRPTVQSHEVFAKLAGQADEGLAAYRALVDGDVAAFNEQLDALGHGTVGA